MVSTRNIGTLVFMNPHTGRHERVTGYVEPADTKCAVWTLIDTSVPGYRELFSVFQEFMSEKHPITLERFLVEPVDAKAARVAGSHVQSVTIREVDQVGGSLVLELLEEPL